MTKLSREEYLIKREQWRKDLAQWQEELTELKASGVYIEEDICAALGMPTLRPWGQGLADQAKDDICENRHQGNQCSIEAHERVEPSKATLHKMILEYVSQVSGATTEEIAKGLSIRYTTASARCSELKRSGMLVASGRKRLTSSGSTAAVLTIGDI